MVLPICFLSRKVFNVLAAIHRGITASFKAAVHKKSACTLLRLPRTFSTKFALVLTVSIICGGFWGGWLLRCSCGAGLKKLSHERCLEH